MTDYREAVWHAVADLLNGDPAMPGVAAPGVLEPAEIGIPLVQEQIREAVDLEIDCYGDDVRLTIDHDQLMITTPQGILRCQYVRDALQHYWRPVFDE